MFKKAVILSINLQVAELATFDEKYQREKQLERATSRPAHAGEGALQGIKGFGMGLFKGVTGIVEKPVEGLKEEGGVGLIKGVGKGLAGAVVKPVVGTVELFSKTAEGVKNTTTYEIE